MVLLLRVGSTKRLPRCPKCCSSNLDLSPAKATLFRSVASQRRFEEARTELLRQIGKRLEAASRVWGPASAKRAIRD